MRPENWNPPIELSAAEQSIAKRIKRAKLFTFLRQYRHQLFDEKFQEELSKHNQKILNTLKFVWRWKPQG
ncbi:MULTISPECIES: hypothetical protein [unclassified Nostoc]|uniref:hypothetical protein n=1 Tax=unclassified Nostoc TaxID=2593658 RepID=UPI001DD6BF1D|nr:hypothetical protein [Nostoc sp. JL23]MBN3877781.1 hypothetical protein [Nostoc sp. JL23]